MTAEERAHELCALFEWQLSHMKVYARHKTHCGAKRSASARCRCGLWRFLDIATKHRRTTLQLGPK